MTTVLATVVAMFILDWRLTLFALALLPLFVWLTKRVGDQRRKVAKVRQESMADISSLVQESLSVSGHPARQDDGPLRPSSRTASERESATPRRPRGAQPDDRPLDDGLDPDDRSRSCRPLVYLFAGQASPDAISIGTVVAFTTLQTRLFFPVGSLLGVPLEVQTSLALFDRVFEYLDQPVDIEEETDDARRARGATSPSTHVWFRYERRSLDAARTSRSTVPAGTTTALVGETGSGRRPLGYLVARLYDVDATARVTIDGVDVRELTFESLATQSASSRRRRYLFHATVRENLRFAQPGRD